MKLVNDKLVTLTGPERCKRLMQMCEKLTLTTIQHLVCKPHTPPKYLHNNHSFPSLSVI